MYGNHEEAGRGEEYSGDSACIVMQQAEGRYVAQAEQPQDYQDLAYGVKSEAFLTHSTHRDM